jgi:hypothetical protein
MSNIAEVLEGLPPDALQDASATAIFYMDQAYLQNIFKFKVHSENIADNISNIQYYTFMTNWPTNFNMNPSNSMLSAPESTGAMYRADEPTEMLVKHDFIRYLAQKLFGTPMATDLFSNESQLLNTLTNIGNNVFQRDISGLLWEVSTTNPNPQLTETYKFDASLNYYYTTDYMTTNHNICRELLQQLIQFNPDRFNNLIPDNNNLFSIPIIYGDTINFQYTINPDPNQHRVTGVAPFGGRVYTIKIIVDDGSHSNITPTD